MKNNRRFFAVARLLPTFAVISVGGCMIGRLLFHIPLEQLGVAVSVWMVCGFAISRILILVVPRVHPAPEDVPLFAKVLSFPTTLAIMFGPVFLAAAGVYHILGMSELSLQSLHIFYKSVAFICFDALALALITLVSHSSIPKLCVLVLNKTAEFFWDILRTPTEMARASHLESFRTYHP